MRWGRGDGDSNPTVPPAFQAAPIVGTGPLTDSGPLPLPGKEVADRITLIVDSVVEGAPAEPIPWKSATWRTGFQPLFELDPTTVEREVRSRQASTIPAWDGWTLLHADGGPLAGTVAAAPASPPNGPPEPPVWPFHIEPVWDTGDNRGWRFRTDVLPTPKIDKPDVPVGGVLVLANQVTIPRAAKYLVLSAQRYEKETKPSRIQVTIDGVAVSEFDVPIRYGWQEARRCWCRSKRGRANRCGWRSRSSRTIRAAWSNGGRFNGPTAIPSVLVLFEDDPGFVGALDQGPAWRCTTAPTSFRGRVRSR